ncbi:MAG: substrate-binding domain-containing protein [Phycisphaeraceae bacterium]
MSPPNTKVGLAIGWHYGCNRQALRGIKQYAAAAHWSFLVDRLSPQFIGAARRWRPDAIIVDLEDPALIDRLLEMGCPIVSVLGDQRVPGHPAVSMDNVAVGRAAAEHLLEKGLRSLAYVGAFETAMSQQRWQGFQEAADCADCPCERFTNTRWNQGHYLSAAEVDDDAQQVRRWLKDLPKPLGVLTFNDPPAQELAQVCRELDLRVPDDVAIVGVDNDDVFCEMADPTLSSVDIPWERIGFEAAALVDRILAGERVPPERMALPPLGVRQRQSSDLLAIGDTQVIRALRFARERAHHAITVEDMAEAAGLSRRTLELRFRRALERTPQQELIRARIERARQLLVDSDLPITAVAERAGFSSLHRFSTAFHRHAGATPTAYRRQFRLRK